MPKSRVRKKAKAKKSKPDYNVVTLKAINKKEHKPLLSVLRMIGKRTKKGFLTAEAKRQQIEHHSSIAVLRKIRSINY